MNGQEIIDFIKKKQLENYSFYAMIYSIDAGAGCLSLNEITENNIGVKDNIVEIF